MKKYAVSYNVEGTMMCTQFYASTDQELRDEILRITGLDINDIYQYSKVSICGLGNDGFIYTCSFDY
jgi:hypothetical protein